MKYFITSPSQLGFEIVIAMISAASEAVSYEITHTPTDKSLDPINTTLIILKTTDVFKRACSQVVSELNGPAGSVNIDDFVMRCNWQSTYQSEVDTTGYNQVVELIYDEYVLNPSIIYTALGLTAPVPPVVVPPAVLNVAEYDYSMITNYDELVTAYAEGQSTGFINGFELL